MEQSFSLYELNNAIKNILKDIFFDGVWVRAEISEIHTNTNGHCYLELIEKEQNTNNIIARQKGVIWANTFKMLKPYFEQSTNMELQTGLKVLIFCSLEMHENYGLSLNITDINPAYTIGEISIQKNKIIEQLTQDGIVDMNKGLPFPVMPQRIAVISSKTAAGFDDFSHQLNKNQFGYKFYIKLFEAVMQGQQTESSVLSALNRILDVVSHFDAVVIIRGGGATADLTTFDNYNIASHFAQFPLPVVCGIGHNRDNTVLDIVSHTSVKTPTAAAELLISTMQIQDEKIDGLSSNMLFFTKQILETNKQNLQNIAYKISFLPKERIQTAIQKLDYHLFNIKNNSKILITNSLNNLKLKQKTIDLLSPQTILQRGYTLVKQRDKFIKSVKNFNEGEESQIIFYDGKITVIK